MQPTVWRLLWRALTSWRKWPDPTQHAPLGYVRGYPAPFTDRSGRWA